MMADDWRDGLDGAKFESMRGKKDENVVMGFWFGLISRGK